MTKLRDYPWWPTRWSCIGNAPNAGQVSAKATFEACRHSTAGLTIAGHYEGTTISAVITHSAAAGGNLKKLRSVLALHLGKPMSFIENLTCIYKLPCITSFGRTRRAPISPISLELRCT